jgi:hypothetical protein
VNTSLQGRPAAMWILNAVCEHDLRRSESGYAVIMVPLIGLNLGSTLQKQGNSQKSFEKIVQTRSHKSWGPAQLCGSRQVLSRLISWQSSVWLRIGATDWVLSSILRSEGTPTELQARHRSTEGSAKSRRLSTPGADDVTGGHLKSAPERAMPREPRVNKGAAR